MTTIVGNLVDVPQVNTTHSGTSVANIAVAVSRKERDQEVTDYVDVTLWSTLAENAAGLDKGTRVIAVGTFKSRKYVDGNGSNRTAWYLDASAFGPELRWATAQVTKTGGRREAVPAGGTWDAAPFTDDSSTPF